MNWIKRLLDLFSFKFAPATPVPIEHRDDRKEVLCLLDGYFHNSGGVAKVIKRFEGAGFVGKVRSWLSDGEKLSINSIEVLQMIGWNDLREISKKADMPVDRLRDLLAELLPIAVVRALS